MKIESTGLIAMIAALTAKAIVAGFADPFFPPLIGKGIESEVTYLPQLVTQAFDDYHAVVA